MFALFIRDQHAGYNIAKARFPEGAGTGHRRLEGDRQFIYQCLHAYRKAFDSKSKEYLQVFRRPM